MKITTREGIGSKENPPGKVSEVNLYNRYRNSTKRKEKKTHTHILVPWYIINTSIPVHKKREED